MRLAATAPPVSSDSVRRTLGVVAALLAAWLAPGATIAAARSGAPELQAKAAIVVEASTGDVLYAKNSRERRAIASTTKLMTVLVALQRSDLDDIFSAANYHAAAGESQIGLRPGERMTVRDLLRAALLPSANDAAAAIAVGTMGSTQAFVAEMNRRAAALGLRDTHYTTIPATTRARATSPSSRSACAATSSSAARPTWRARRCAAARASASSSTATRSCAASPRSTA
jgi:D-alanyl-D-alanine carboxypeptidase